MLNLPSATKRQTVAGKKVEIVTEDEDSEFITEQDDENGDMVADLNNLPDSWSQVTGAQTSIINDQRRVSSMVRLNKKNPIVNKPQKKVGTLKKWSPALFAGWQERIVEIKERTLKYYKQKKNDEPVMAGILNFDLYACVVVPVPNEP